MWKLTIEDDEGQQTSLELVRDEYTIGRADGCAICLTERNVSRSHCALRRQGDAWALQDLQSYNGTYVNGARVVDVVALKPNDIIQLGDYRMELLDERAALVAQAQAEAQAMTPELRRPARLIMVIGPTPGLEYPLQGAQLTVGRAEEAGISINHSSVSRHHAEMHALGDGRWEVIDLGSSNGIRINGVELRRGIMEPGDAFELGDVRLRFVGAGKWLRPTSVDLTHPLPGLAAQIEPPAARSIGKVVALGAVLVALIVVAVVVLTRGNGGSASAEGGDELPMATNLEAARELLAEAIEVAKTDLDKAHAMLSRVPESSPVREEQDFKDIEGRWADAMLARAEKATDPNEKRRILNEIFEATGVDADRRQKAADMLTAMGDAPKPPIPGATPGGRRPVPGTTGGGTPPVGTTAPPATTSTKTDTKAPSTPQGETKYDENSARRALEAKVWSGSASEAEIRMLRAICSSQGDRVCRDRCTQMLKAKSGG